jgi:hypothetical protein
MTASASAPPGIFISYRRRDAAAYAGWLFDRLAGHYGRDQIFKDVDSIQLGDDFAAAISDAVASCQVLLALIGDRWLTISGKAGRRLDNPRDFVRLEIEAALSVISASSRPDRRGDDARRRPVAREHGRAQGPSGP